MNEEIKSALEALKNQVIEKTAGFEGIEAKSAKLVTDMEAKLLATNETEIKAVKEALEARIDALVAEAKAKVTKKEVKSFSNEF